VFVDVHGHLAPYGEAGGGPPSLRDPEAAIEAKRALGIGLTIIGSPVGAGSMLPGPGRDNYRQSADPVRAHNEWRGDLVDRFPEALRAYAYLDPFGGDPMLAQAAELVGDHRFVGVVVNSSVDGELLGSPRAADFFAMLAETGVPALMHPPAEPIGTASLPALGLVEHIVRPCDVTMAIASIVCGGWLERYPDLVLIAAAGGGAASVLAEKLELAVSAPGPASGPVALTGPAGDSLRRLYVECSCPSPAQMRANLTVFGPERVLLGTDAPPLMDNAKAVVEVLAGLPEPERDRVGTGNAEAIFRLGTAPGMGRDHPAVAHVDGPRPDGSGRSSGAGSAVRGQR
jgi:predicted TIM-barrel fold metal-dependent hydrolase